MKWQCPVTCTIRPHHEGCRVANAGRPQLPIGMEGGRLLRPSATRAGRGTHSTRRLPKTSAVLLCGKEERVQVSRDILVVEQSAPIVEILRIVLEGSGFAVHSVARAAEAREVLASWRPALVLLDMDMDAAAGAGLVRWMRERQGERIPVVLMGADDESRWLARSLRADGWLAMPFDLDELESVVGRLATE